MDEKLTVKELSKDFKSVEELKDYVHIQFKALQAATVRIKELEEKLAAKANVQPLPPHPVYRMETDAAEDICLAEIEKLQNRAVFSELPLEDVKKLDLLVKNLLLLRANKKKKDVALDLPTEEDALLQIASGNVKKHE